MGAIATGGVRVLNEDVVNFLQIPLTIIDAVAAQEQQELDRRTLHYRNGRPPLTCMDIRSSWSMMAWRPALLCALLSWHCVNSSRPGLSLPFLLLPVLCAMSWKLWRTRSCVQRHQNRSMPLACGTRTLNKPAMQRSATCSHRQCTSQPPSHI